MTFAWGPGPFADVHRPPDADEFEGINPAEICSWWVIQSIHGAIGSEFDGRIGNHDEAPRRVKR